MRGLVLAPLVCWLGVAVPAGEDVEQALTEDEEAREFDVGLGDGD